MKRCPQCEEHKDLSEFYKNCTQFEGVTAQCKTCCKANAARRRAENPEVTREEVRQARKRNGKQYEAVRSDAKREYRAENAEHAKAYAKNYRQANLPKVAAYRAKARAAKSRATPAWANQKYIGMFYEMAKLEAARLGVGVHVDHIVPLQSSLVCGLHVEHNLQLLTKTANLSKSNRVWPDMPQAL